MHFHRSGIGVALIGAVAVIGLCSIALPALAADGDSDGGTPAVTAVGGSGKLPGKVATEPAGGIGARGGPVNDDCSNAVELFDGVTAYSTLGATTDGVNLPPQCEKGFGLVLGNDIWYVYAAACAGTVTVSTCNDVNYDSRLAAYLNTGCPVGNDDLVGCNDDGPGCDNFSSIMTFPATSGTEYLVRVGGFETDSGTGNLTVDIACGCQEDADCDDGDACTDDICNDNGLCSNDEIDCDDGDQCTDNFCADGACQAEDNGDCCPSPALCDGDVNGDELVDPLDTGAILARFGLDPCNEETCQYDVNCDGVIDPLDIGYVLARFGLCDPPDVCKFADSCPPGTKEATDNCEDAPVNDLSPGETLNFFGDNTDATSTCAALGALVTRGTRST